MAKNNGSKAPKKISKAELEKLNQQLETAMSKAQDGASMVPVDESLEGQLPAPALDFSSMSIREAAELEGITPHYIVKKLKELLTMKQPKWNQKLKRWDYFIDGELVRKCLEMGIKMHGGFDSGPQVKVNINVDLESILRNPHLSPEEKRKQIQNFRLYTLGATDYRILADDEEEE
jgi:hypothetical protein